MKRLTLALSVMLATFGLVPTAPAAGVGNVAKEPGPGYFATANVEWLKNIPLNTDSAGARILGNHLYVTEDRGLTIWDITDPVSPLPVSFTPVPQTAYLTEEDVDTNGKVLVIGSYGELVGTNTPVSYVSVLDVSNKAAPEVVAQVPNADNHTFSCILDCSFVYGSAGVVIDLRDPANPVRVKNPDGANLDWRSGLGITTPHDVTEVAPGLVVTSSRPVKYLDVSDPLSPKEIAASEPWGDNRFIHGNLWPNAATDDFLLVGGETSGNCNQTNSGAFMTFKVMRDDSDPEIPVKERPVTGFSLADEYRVATGLPTEGNSPYDQYCAHWFTTHPAYRDGGVVASGWYEHGTRFLNVTPSELDADGNVVGGGEITELGYFLPVGGSTSAAYWVTDEILYAIDYQRGIDILRFDPDAAPGPGQLLPAPPAFNVVPPSTPTGLVYDGPRRRGQYVCPLPI